MDPDPQHHAFESSHSLSQLLMDLAHEISSIGNHSRKIFKTERVNLTRRVKLLEPFLEEVREFKGTLSEQAVASLSSLGRALHDARDLLRSCNNSSKIYLVLEREAFGNRFLSVAEKLEQALEAVPFSLLNISDEVQEQVQLVHSQLKGAQGRADAQDTDLYSDLAVVLSRGNNKERGTASLERLAEKLQLKTMSNIKQESRALNRIAISNGGERKEMFEQMFLLLRQLKNLALRDYALMDIIDHQKNAQIENLNSPVVPDEFRCPISFELMKDPVIVATGQIHPSDDQAIEVLLQKLLCGQPDVQRAAAKELRILAKESAENRIRIAASDALPLLVGILSSQDQHTREHAVTALLNLSLHDGNKKAIVAAGAIVPIVHVLKSGTMEARENAAATLFSLSVVDEYKVAIGSSGAIPALTSLLCDGSLRGKKDAASALINLSTYQGNRVRAIRALVVPSLMQLLVDTSTEMVNEVLEILSLLAMDLGGRAAIGQASAVPILVELIKTGSRKTKEKATSVLLALCLNDPEMTFAVRQLGAHGPLRELVKNGTSRAHHNAVLLLDNMKKQGKNCN